MKQGAILIRFLAVILALLLTASLFLLCLRLTLFNDAVFEYAVSRSDFGEKLESEIIEYCQPALGQRNLPENIVNDALDSFEFRNEVIRYLQLKIAGIETEIDSKAFNSYLESMITLAIPRGEMKEVTYQELVDDTAHELLVAYNMPFLNPELLNLLNSSQRYYSLLNNMTIILAIASGLVVVVMFFVGLGKGFKAYRLALWLAAFGTGGIGAYLSLYKFVSSSASFTSLATALIKALATIMILMAVLIAYLLFFPICYRAARKISSRLLPKTGLV